MADVFQSRVPNWFLRITDLLVLLGTLIASMNLWKEFRSDTGVSTSQLIITAAFLIGLTSSVSSSWNRLRYALLEVDEEEVRFCPINRFLRPIYRVPIREIESLLPSSDNVLVLRLRSGEVRKFTLFELRKRERKAAREAIQRRLTAHQRSRKQA